jgi:hypothetical protein
MFRFDHDVSRQGDGGLAFNTAGEPLVCETTPIEHVAAPTISWARVAGYAPRTSTRSESQMGV